MHGNPLTGSPLPRLRELLKREQLDTALRLLIDSFTAMGADPALGGRPFPFPEFDQVCEEIGAASAFELFAATPPPAAAEHDVVLVTETFVQGGHAEIARDLADWGARPVVIVATNLHDRADPVLPELRAHPRVAGVTVLDDRDLLGRLRSLQSALAHPAVRRVLVLCHGHDSVAIAAAAALHGKPVLFFHHCDHSPCLGCFMPRAVHVDLHNLAFEQCRGALGLSPSYLCLTSRDERPGRAVGRHADPAFKSITCGAEHKLQRLPYPISYQDVVVRLLGVTGGVHYHVGPVSDARILAMGDALEQAGLSREAFVPVGHVAGFRGIAAALDADLYIPTLPQAGGKALVDAMCAGLPVLVHENAIDRLWGGRDLVYPEAPVWTTLDGMEACLRRFMEGAYWREQATASRDYYDRYHANALFAAMLGADAAPPDPGSQSSAPPPLKPYRPDLALRAGARALARQLTAAS